MKLKKYFGASDTVMKFSEAREFRSKKLIEYKQITPQSSTITSTTSSIFLFDLFNLDAFFNFDRFFSFDDFDSLNSYDHFEALFGSTKE
ncbi:unnamed protein product [Rhizophagus irregularis]|nr:unnamed protein product [Rhizophagus irregularis]